MACRSTCCAPPKPVADDFLGQSHITQSTSKLDKRNHGGDACSSNSCTEGDILHSDNDAERRDGDCGGTISLHCCNEPVMELVSGAGDCDSGNSDSGDQKRKDSCCYDAADVSFPVSAIESSVLTIERGCCDESCLDRIALRACETEKHIATIDGNSKTAVRSLENSICGDKTDGTACDFHTRTIRSQYADKLETLGCICRTLLEFGTATCQAPSSQLAAKGEHSARSSSAARRKHQHQHCTERMSRGILGHRQHDSERSPRRSRSKNEDDIGPLVTRSFNDQSDAVHIDEKGKYSLKQTEATRMNISRLDDPEKGLSGTERVVLAVSGMTCTGCESKLKRTLMATEAVANLKTSLILARAEFDLNLAFGSADEIIKYLARTSEFRCERIMDPGSQIDINVPGNASEFVKQKWPYGVTDIKAVDNETVRVTFDSQIVGARELCERGWSSPVTLAPQRPDSALQAGKSHVQHVGLMTLLSAILTIPVLVLTWAPLPKKEITYGSISLAFATIIQFVVAGPFYQKALKALIFAKMVEMDLLVVLSTSAAYMFSVISFGYLVAGKPLSTGQFFETSTLLVTLIMAGRYVGALARQKAVDSISIRSLQAVSAIIFDETTEEEAKIDVRLLQYGDLLKIYPESSIPTDGSVISGDSEVNEAMITGEAGPVDKHPKSAVMAGSVNGSGTLIVRLTRLPSDNTISTIARLVDEAKFSKPKVQETADQVASYFVPVIIAVTVVVFAAWIAIGMTIRKESASESAIKAITYAITVLIVSCPCGIGLAVPMVIVTACGVAAENGIVFKSAEAIELLHKTSHVVFDKTGTLTEGNLEVRAEEYVDGDFSSSASLLLGLIGGIKHPVSQAVTTHLRAKSVVASTVTDLKTVPGNGLEGTAQGRHLRAGNSRWLNLSCHPRVEPILAQGYTVFCFVVDESLTAVFGLEDSLRLDALSLVQTLREQSISIHMISGDDDAAVKKIASQLSIPDSNFRSRCSPASKSAYIEDILATPIVRGRLKTRQTPVVVFCGDGTNDAVALAKATIGIHMSGGTDVAKSAADVILVRPNLSALLTMIALSKKSMRRVMFNFGWSFLYNLFAILLAAGAFVKVRIPPEYGGLGELVSVLPVIAAAVLLRYSRLVEPT